MPAWLCIAVAALIYVCVVSPLAAVVLGRVIRLRDEQVPQSPGGVGEGEATRRRRVGAR